MANESKIIMSRFQDSITEKDELPDFDKEGLQKFFLYSYDSELGWTKKPFTSGFENGRQGAVIFRINQRGSRFNSDYEDMPAKISMYGDSFAMSRQVNDDETITYYLSELTKTNVLNWGVGNYGLDQAFLRLKREYPKNKTDVVIQAFVPEQILRVMSYWKHYLEYGNHFSFKPMFKLEKDKLRLIPNIMDEEEKFSKLKDLIPEIKKHDYWYERKFKKDFGIKYTLDERMESNLKWRVNSYKDEKCLKTLLAVINLFKEYSEEKGFKPIVVILPYKNDILFAKENEYVYYETFTKACMNKVFTIDLMPYFMKLDENTLNKYFSDDTRYGGHYSKEGNKFVADILYRFLEESGIIKS